MVLPSPVPGLLPWVGILLLLALKPNRCSRAWWILAPLALATLVAGYAGELRSGPRQLLDIVNEISFGIAGLWLLTTYVRRSHAFLTFLLSLLVLVGGSGLVFLLKEGLVFAEAQEWIMGVAVIIFASASAVALSLAGLLCRSRYGAVRLSLWLMILFLATALLALAPFAIFAIIAGQGGPTLLQFLTIIAIMAAIGFGAMLPFLVLSFANGFYAERLKNLLHVRPGTAPPLSAPNAPPVSAVGQSVMDL